MRQFVRTLVLVQWPAVGAEGPALLWRKLCLVGKEGKEHLHTRLKSPVR